MAYGWRICCCLVSGNLYILYLKTTDEAVEVKKSPPNVCISGVVIVFIVPIWQGPMSSMIVFIDLEGLSGV